MNERGLGGPVPPVHVCSESSSILKEVRLLLEQMGRGHLTILPWSMTNIISVKMFLKKSSFFKITYIVRDKYPVISKDISSE